MGTILDKLFDATQAAVDVIREEAETLVNDPDSILNKGIESTKLATGNIINEAESFIKNPDSYYNEGIKATKATAYAVLEGSESLINNPDSIVNKSIELARTAAENITDQTKIGTAVGGTLGLLAAGTGSMGIAAMGGAIGVPVALMTALIGAGLGSRWGAEIANEELINKLESAANTRSADGLNATENDAFIERILGKEAHFKSLDNAINEASNTLCIRSGWVSNSVVNTTLSKKLRDALDRGVTIYIETGWRRSGEESASETAYSLEAKRILRELILYSHDAHLKDPKTNIGRIFVGDVPTHIKEIVVDSDYYISGSNNWLSNGMHFNKEASHIIRLPQIAREIRDETIVSVRMHLSILHQLS